MLTAEVAGEGTRAGGDSLRPPTAAGRVEDRWSRRAWLWWGVCVGGLGLLMAAYRWLDRFRAGRGWDPRPPLIDELTALLGAGLLFFGVRALVRWRPLSGPGWIRALPLYALAVLVFSAVHTTMNWASRSALYPLVGLSRYRYGPMPAPYAMELPIDVILFAIMVAVLLGVRQGVRSRAQALESARLASALSASRLEALTRSLEPHFLFNALNTISATMYRDVGAADEMIERLGDLLRVALDRRRAAETTVREELECLGPYLALLRARFEDRLAVTAEVGDDAWNARLPSMLLQPLVENAVRHGGAEREGRGEVRIRVVRLGEQLAVTVEDDGPGAPFDVDPLRAGHGLSATAERLRLLYATAHTIEAANGPAGGFRVTVRVPFRDRGDGERCAS